MYIQTMAKTLMVSNSAYEELKKLKEGNKSFSEVIMELVSRNSGSNIWKHFGVLKGDTEYAKIKKELKSGWRKWQKRYA